jgi:hypothetical protein
MAEVGVATLFIDVADVGAVVTSILDNEEDAKGN